MVKVIVKPWLCSDMVVIVWLSTSITVSECQSLESGVRLFLSLCILNGFPFSTFLFKYTLEKVNPDLSNKIILCKFIG